MKKILWIDDEIDSLGSLIYFLKDSGYDVKGISNGHDALNILENEKFDLVLLDQMMPGMDGLTVLENIRKKDPFIPVVMFTKVEDEEMINEAYGFRVDAFIIKPVKPKQLLAVCKGFLNKKEIEHDAIPRNYSRFIRDLQMFIGDKNISSKDWQDIYIEFILWRMRIQNISPEILDLSESFRKDMNISFFKYVKENYRNWINDSEFIMSHNIVEKKVFPLLDEKPIFFILIDCLRLDQYFYIEKKMADMVKERNVYYAILPTATPYARNAIFSGMKPLEISKKFPDLWDMEDEISQNRYEKRFWSTLLSKKVREEKTAYYKVHSEEEFGIWYREWKKKTPLYVEALVINHLDLLIHHRSKEESLKNLIPDEYSIASITGAWADSSFLIPTIETALSKGYRVFLTTDHGSIMVNKPVIVKGGKEVSWNLRYKFGQSLKCPNKGSLFISSADEYGLPVRREGERWCIAGEDIFYIYPSNPNLYTKQYSKTFQHGGITTEEMIIPYAIIDK